MCHARAMRMVWAGQGAFSGVARDARGPVWVGRGTPEGLTDRREGSWKPRAVSAGGVSTGSSQICTTSRFQKDSME